MEETIVRCCIEITCARETFHLSFLVPAPLEEEEEHGADAAQDYRGVDQPRPPVMSTETLSGEGNKKRGEGSDNVTGVLQRASTIVRMCLWAKRSGTHLFSP